MIFDEETLGQINRQFLDVLRDCQALQLRYLEYQYRDDRTREFVLHGLCRRLKTMTRCLENVFNIIPPNRVVAPSIEARTDAAINIQAFVFNTFGAIDNLAWIYVYESGLTREGGEPLRRMDVGLRENNELVRQSLSMDFQEFLAGKQEWFEYLESF